MKKASWIVLSVVGVLLVLISSVSAITAYWGDWAIGPTSLVKLEAIAPGTEVALRGSRATAAGFGVAYGVLLLAVVLGPHRRGESWAGRAILGSMLGLALIILLRAPVLGTTLGVTAAVVPLALVLLGLALDRGSAGGSGRTD